jgi:hypothetical protein
MFVCYLTVLFGGIFAVIGWSISGFKGNDILEELDYITVSSNFFAIQT